MSETFDVDRAFDDLTRDVGGVSAARGAARAVTASRRRRAVGAGAVAVVVLTAGGLALTSLGDDPAREVPVAPDVPDAVTPAPLTAAALAAATSPWLDSWTEDDATTFTDLTCINAGGAKPQADDSTEFNSGPRVSASRVYTEWADSSHANEVAERITASFARCSEGEMVGTAATVPGAAVTAYAWPEGDEQVGVVWVAVAGDRLALLTVAGADNPPDEVRDRVAEALVAGLTYDKADWDS